MKDLILIRHAKSDQSKPRPDKDRPLDPKGIIDATIVAKDCVKYLPEVYLVWSSTAKRASQTATIFANIMAFPLSEITFKDELYTFDEQDLENSIKTCDDQFDSLIVFGHNDAITNFVNKFGDKYIDNVPTSGFVSLALNEANWKDIGKGTTIKTIFPKDLRSQ